MNYKCLFCENTFGSRRDIRRHVQRVHDVKCEKHVPGRKGAYVSPVSESYEQVKQ